MSIFGVDISRYQDSSAMDGYDFVILNVEDPTFADKAHYAHDHGIVWDIYKWIYPGTNGEDMFHVAKARVDAAGVPGRVPGYWADYEQAGVNAGQIDQWFTAADRAGVQAGWYTYLYLVNAQGRASGRDLWLAYYPSASGDYWPSMSDTARSLGAKIHQYTSTGGTIDKNVIIDEAWWAAWSTGAAPLPPLPPLPTEDEEDVTQYITLQGAAAGSDESGAWEKAGNTKRHVLIDEWNQALFFASIAGKPAPQALPVSQQTWDSLPTVTG